MTDSQGQLSRSTTVFAAGTMVSRVVGLLRDVTWAALIPSVSLDAFIVAFKLPNMLRELVGEGAVNAAVVPVLSETLENEPKERFRELVSAAMSAMIVVLAVLTLLGVIVVPALLQGLNVLRHITGAAPLPVHDIKLMVSLARWTFPYLFFIGLAAFAMGPLFTLKHYATPSLAPALLNISIILACFTLRHRFADPGYALVIGVWLGGVAQVAVLYFALAKQGKVWLPGFHLTHPGVGRMLWLMVPVVIGQAAGEVNKLVDTLFAAQLGHGTVTALYMANRVVQLPLSVFGVATAVAILPLASRAATRRDPAELRGTLMAGFRQSFFLITPALLGLICLRAPIVRLLFERGHFVAEDTQRTATALGIYALGLLSFAWVKVAVSGFYAAQDTRTPVIVGSASMLLNILLNILLVRPLGYRGLALATSISFTVNFVLLFVLLGRRVGSLWDWEFLGGLVRMGIAAGVMTVVAYGTYIRTAWFFPEDSTAARIITVAVPVFASGLAYMALCRILAVPELANFLASMRRRPAKR